MEIVSDFKKAQEINGISPPEKPEDIGSALESIIQHVGEMGLYQKLLFVAMLPFGMSWAFVYMGQMFLTATPQEHWCFVPELAGLDVELRRNLSIPGAAAEDYDHCTMYDADWDQVLASMTPPGPGTPTVPCQNGWEFLFEDIPYSTIVNEREWVCDRAYLVPVAQAVNFVGSICGGILCGSLADIFGRVPALVLANIFGVAGGVATIFTTGFWDFAVCRFLQGMSYDSLFLLFYILVMEFVGTKHRTWVANLSIAFFFGSGCMVLPWLALWLADWRLFSLITAAPMMLVVLAPFLVPESIRWLVSKGKIDRAVRTLRRFERVNRTKIPQDVLDDFINIAKTTKEPADGNLKALLKTPSIGIILSCVIIAFVSVAVVFDGLIRMSENLGLDFFITFTVSSATEIPSIALLVVLLDRFGRRKLVFLPIVASAVICFGAAFVPMGWGTVGLATAARFLANMAYGAIIQWTPELLPTGVRAAGSALVHISAAAGIVISPFIVFSERAWEGLPLVLVALVGLAGGAAALLLPETAGRPMPQTLDDWQRLAETRPYQRKKMQKEQELRDSTTPSTVGAYS